MAMACLPAPRLIVLFALLCAGPAWSQEKKEAAEPKAIERPAAASSAENGEKTEAVMEGEVATAEPEVELTPQQKREQMLERIADTLSKRMQSLTERERVLREKEKALRLREETLEERESVLEARENVVRRREKLPPPHAWNGPKAPTVVGKYATVIDAKTMQFYFEKNSHDKTPVASTQKLLTALIICGESDLDEKITVPKEVLNVEPTVIGVKPGQKYTRRELLRALLVRSGNDIAATLAIDNAGSVEAFAGKMNQYARSLGMENSHFVNPHGLPAEGQHSTAHDMALAAFEAYQIPDIREMVKTRTCEFVFSDGTTQTLYNTNRVLSNYEYCNGMKTGFTYASGHCLVCSGSKDGADRIVVVINSHKPYIWSDSEKLLDWALNLEVEPLPEESLAAVH